MGLVWSVLIRCLQYTLKDFSNLFQTQIITILLVWAQNAQIWKTHPKPPNFFLFVYMRLIIMLPPSPQPIFKLVLNSSYANFTVWAPNAQIRKTVCLFPHIVHVLDIQFARVLWIRSMYWMLKMQPLDCFE